MKDRTNHFMRLSQLGYRRLVPIVPPGAELSENSSLYKRLHGKRPRDDRGKAPGVRGIHGKWRSFDWMKSDSVKTSAWHDMGAGVGIKLGPLAGLDGQLAAIDADTLDKEHAYTIKGVVEKHIGIKPPLRIGQSPKALYLIRTDIDVPFTLLEFGEETTDGRGRARKTHRVEILTAGRQFVAHGIHPKTLKPYDWVYGLPPAAELPYVPAATLDAIMADLEAVLPNSGRVRSSVPASHVPVDPEKLRGDPKLVEKAVRSLPNTSEHFPHRDDYIRVMYAIRGALPDDPDLAFELFEDWALRWDDPDGNDPAVVRQDWERMPHAPTIGAGYLFDLHDRFVEGIEPGGLLAESWFDAEAASNTTGDGPLFPEEKSQSARTFTFTSLDEAADAALTATAAPLIKGVLDQGAMTVLYGESNAGKTFVAMDIAAHVAAGMDWSGRKTAKLPVLYIAAEGGQGARKRAAALKAKYGMADCHFLFLIQPVNLLRADADLRPLLQAIRTTGLEFGLVVVDTLSRAMAGGDENASTDMGAMVKHLDVLRNTTGAHLMVVHHSGKDRARGARGHSLLRAATDTEIEIADRVISVTKQRDLDGSFSSAFELDVVTLGVDQDGDPVTSCTVRLVARHGARVGSGAEMTPSEETIAAAVAELDAFNESENVGVSVAELSDFLAEKLKDSSQNSVRHHLKRMVEKGVLTKCRRGRWKLTVAESGQGSGQNVFQ